MKLKFSDLVEGRDYVITGNGLLEFLPVYHLNRGTCCGNKCKHCPYTPKYIKGNDKM